MAVVPRAGAQQELTESEQGDEAAMQEWMESAAYDPYNYNKRHQNFYVQNAPQAHHFFPDMPVFGTPQPMIHPNIITPTPEQLMARYYPSGFYDGDPVNDKLKYEFARAAHAEDYYWLIRARYTNTMDMMAAIRSPDLWATLPRPPGQMNAPPGNYAGPSAPPGGIPGLFSPGDYIKGMAKPLFRLK